MADLMVSAQIDPTTGQLWPTDTGGQVFIPVSPSMPSIPMPNDGFDADVA